MTNELKVVWDAIQSEHDVYGCGTKILHEWTNGKLIMGDHIILHMVIERAVCEEHPERGYDWQISACLGEIKPWLVEQFKQVVKDHAPDATPTALIEGVDYT